MNYSFAYWLPNIKIRMNYLLFICIALAINGSYIPYQAHGFNDLPYMI